MTMKQEAFNTVAIALRKQRVASYSPSSGCVYRGPNGLKCAVGHLIPDSQYKKEMENVGASHLLIKYDIPALKSGDDNFVELLDDMQSAHDSCLADYGGSESTIRNGLKAWQAKMREIAEQYGLDASKLTEPLD
jgi:hypothetical protein